MKSNISFVLLSIVLVFSITTIRAQNPNLNLIVFSKEYKQGFYRTFQEFRNNSPSIPFDIEPRNYQAASLHFKGHTPCPDNTPIWGFCDGMGIYISKTFLFSKKGIYYRIQNIGRFCDYQTESEQVGIDFNTGQMFIINKENIESIIFKDEELYTNFSKDVKKMLVAREYLRYYSKRHFEEIEMIKVAQ